jgi:hypothetical protein
MKKSDLDINPEPSTPEPSTPEPSTIKNKGLIGDYFDIEQIESRLYELYPIGLVPRSDIDRATGGILNSRTMSNLDTRGTGIKIKFNVGKKRCYPIEAIVEFIAARISYAA